ncbi:MAG: glycoside hydrolase family 5 protein [Spirochaetes bacterium]|nr:glycoside hydrolase family 5 protein [Spirochaetota bacterium]
MEASLKQFCVVCTAVLASAFFSATLTAANMPFSRGVNLTRWFEAPSPRTIQFTRYTIQDFRNIKSLGADVIRLPIHLHAMTTGKPDYVLDPLFLEFLEQAVDMAEGTGLHLILDNHTFDPVKPTPPDTEDVLLKVWPQMAARFKDRSDLLIYEVLNEPHGIDIAKWGKIQGKVIKAIRKIDTRHAIIVGAANYNCIMDLGALPRYADTNLIYTFHFYEPMLFTHQGTAFTTPSLADLSSVPYPPDAAPIPPVPKSLQNTWWADRLKAYKTEGTFAYFKKYLDAAVKFGTDRGVRVFCGEFGAYKSKSTPADRVRWYRDVRTYLEGAGVAWTSWDYHGSFGIFRDLTGGRFNHDLDISLVEALGFTAPPQEKWLKKAEAGEIVVYEDFPSRGIFIESWQNSGLIDFYSATKSATGRYSIVWKDAARFDAFLFAFDTVKDFSRLVKEGYALRFMARASGAKCTFEVRFMNGETGPMDYPWRMVRTVDASLLIPDGEWHLIQIPLSDMADVGAWKRSEQKWYFAERKFSWANVVSLQFAAEQQDLSGAEIGIDEIRIAK